MTKNRIPAAKNFMIRRAIETDLPAMMTLIRELAAYEKEPQAVTVSESEFRDTGFGEHPVWWAFVAESKESKNVVGMALYYIRYSTWKGRMLFLEDIIVQKRFRSLGIGKMLMNELISEAERLKIAGLCWQVLDWNKPAIHFYEKYTNATFSGEWLNVQLSSKQER